MKNLFRNITALFMTFCLIAGMTGLPLTAYAEERAEIQAAGLPGIRSGHNNTAANTTIIGFGGKEWYVIGYDGSGVASDSGTMTLLLKTPHDSGGYGKERFNFFDNNYNDSLLKNATDNAYNQLPENEKELVLLRSAVSSDAGFWPLSTSEAQQIALGDDWRSSVLQYSDKWWLRSPASDVRAGMVYASGQLLFDEVYELYAIRPAFNLNLDSVLFTSSASGAGAKSSAALGGGLIGLASPSGKLKFTVRESDTSRLSLTSATLDKTVVRAGGKLTVTFGGALTGPGKYVSCVLTDNSGTVKYYGKLSDQASGQASIKVPALAAGNYKIKLFNEQVSGENHTDFCSAPIEIDITVDDSPVLNPGANLSGTQVYFGAYNSAPIKWHIVAMDSTTITLWTTTSMADRNYGFINDHAYWSGSQICQWLNGTGPYTSDGYLPNAFSPSERAMMVNYGTTEITNLYYHPGYEINISQKIVLPSIEEMGREYATGTWGISSSKRALGHYWWLRSPGGTPSEIYKWNAAQIQNNGYGDGGGTLCGYPKAIHPAFKLKLDSILLISDAEGGKSTGVGGNLPELDTPSGAVKFTLPDTAQNLDLCATVAQSTQEAGTLQFSYKAATTGAGQYVSCVLEDDVTGEVLYYGKLADSSANANGNLSIPLAGVASGTYQLKVFSEKINDDFFTDYCSTTVGMTVNVTNGIGTVSDFSGTKLKIAAVPAANPGLKYSGGEQTGVNEGEGYTISGHRATNVGSYTATASLEPGYDWEDGATGDKTINWSIAKADSPAAPTGLAGIKTTAFGGSDGKITGTSTAMEYADNAGFNNAQSCSASETTGLTAGIYYVRLKATDTHEASRHASVYVPSGNYPYNAIITVPEDIYDNTPFDLEVKITDSAGNTLEDYTGTVRFGVSIASAGVPESYSFTAVDKGVKTFNMRFTESGSAKITVTGEDINPIAYWKFDNAYTDSSGNGYTVTPHGAAFSEDKPALQFTNGKSLLLNRNDDYCDIPDDVALGNKSFSISFWAKKSVWVAGYIVGSRLNGGNNNTLHVGYRDANNFTFAFFANDLDVPAPNDGVWHHWTVTYDAETRNRVIYCDGEEAASDISASNFLSNAPLRIGTAFDNIGNFDGNVDDLRIYYLALPPGAVKGLYEGTEYPGFRGEKQVFVNPKAYSLSVSPQHGSVSAGQANLVTLKVLSGSGEVDTSFTGSKNVTISGIGSAPNGEFGAYDGNTLGLTTTLTLPFQSGEFAGELLLSKAGSHNLNFSVEGVHVPEASLSLTVTPGTAHKLILLQDIAAPLVNGGQFSVQPELAVTDHYGNIVTGDNSTQIIAYTSDQPGYDLSGTTAVTVQNGEAVFTDLGATGYTNEIIGAKLRFRESENKLIEAESSAVTLPRDKTAKTLRITVAPGLKKVGIPFDATVEALDMAGERAESYRGKVTFTSSSGETFAYNFLFTESNKGSKTFSAAINTEGTKTLTATDGLLTASVQVSIADADGRFFVSYDANGSGNAPPAHKVAAGQSFTAPQADGMTPPTDKLFKEWNTEADGSGTACAPGAQILMPEQPLTLYAIWRDLTPDEKIAEALAALNWDTIKGGNSTETDVKNALNLIKTGAQDTTITWSASPEGLIDTGTGEVTRPTDTDKTVTLTATISKTDGTSQTKVFTLTVKHEPVAPSITTTTLPNGTVGTAYSQTLAADSDTPITWSIGSGDLPDGLTLNGTTGVISGTPTTADTFNFAIKAANSEGYDTKTLEIVIGSATVTGAEISPDTGGFDRYSPGDVTTAITWNSATTVTGISDGAMSLASLAHYVVSGGTLTVKEAYLETQAVGIVVLTIAFDQGDPATLTVSITDSTPPSINPASASYDLTAPDDVATTITWNSASTVTGVVYDANSLASGTDYTVTGSALTINNSYLSGLAPSEGDTLVFDISFDTGVTAALTVHVMNSYTPSGDADLSDLTVGGSTVSGFDPADDEYNVELPCGTQPGSAAATVGATANDPLAQVGVTQASALPGSATVTVTAEDGTIKNYTVNFTLGSAPGTAPTIITASLPGGTVGTFYSQTLAAAGDTPITWSINSGDLPGGLSLSGNTISGTPTTAGTFGFTVKAENAEGSDTQTLSLEISAVKVTTVTVKTAPTKTIYTAGETLDLTGLEVTLHKSDSTTEDVAFADFTAKGITTTPANGTVLSVSDTSVTITYTADSKSVTQSITVNPAPVTVTSVTVKTAPIKTTYTAGETLDLSGLVVTLHRSDSSEQDVALADFGTNGITTNPANGAMLSTSNTTVTITYTADSKSVTQNITVNPATPADTTPPTFLSGSTIDVSGVDQTSLALTWNMATDNTTAQSALQYLVYKSGSNNLGSVTDIEANGTPIGSYEANIATKTVTGLTPNTIYYFNVIVKDEAGNKICYTAQTATTEPLTVPRMPKDVTATAGDGQATVSFTAPGSDGGAAITGYTVTSSPVGGTDTNAGTTSLSHVITGLTNGVEYTFTVTATNSVGTSEASLASNSVTPTASITDKTLVSVTTPAAITMVPNGTAKIASALGLPSTVTLVTDDGNVQASVAWAVYACSYDPSVTTAQTFTVDGTVTLPSGVINPNNVPLNTSISVSVRARSSGGGNNGGGAPSTPAAPEYKAEVKAENGEEATLPVTVDKNAKTASVNAGSQSLAKGGTVITIPTVPDVDIYSVGIPVPSLSTAGAQGTLTINTDNGSVTVPSNMLTGVADISGSKAQISIGQGDKDSLPDDVKAAIGDRPLVQLTLSIDGKQTDWNNPDAPVTVSIPYTPTAAERANPESIVIWYIDGSGNVATISDGRYDPVTGTVNFFTTHFSDYAVAYVHKTFSDLDSVEWARKAIEVMASKGITNGTGDGTTFSPGVNITRADFIVLLIKTLGLTAEFTENFDDVQPGAYYYNAIGVAKKLGIAAGSGNNLFKPTENISRQDMMVLAARALEKYQGLKAADNSAVLEGFSDRKDIAEYAVNSLATLVESGLIEGSGNKLTPRSYTTRAEVAVFLYNIYNKYPKAPVITASTLLRLAGQSRIDTALSVARTAYPDKIESAVLATADNYPDALAGSVLAYQLDAPILLVGSSEADQKKVLDYLKTSMEPDGTVYIFGGTGVISQGFAAKLSTSGITNISRIAGNDRYETSVKITEQLNVKTGTPVVLVSGENYPDALSVSSIAAQKGWPILLVQKDGISDAVSRELAAIKPDKVYIIGLEGAISTAVENQAAKLTGLAAEEIVRIGGADRYATSLAVAEYFNLGSQAVCVATGNNFPDALAGSVYAAKQKAPIILTDSTLPVQAADYVESRKPAELTILGGEAVVGSGIEQLLIELSEI